MQSSLVYLSSQRKRCTASAQAPQHERRVTVTLKRSGAPQDDPGGVYHPREWLQSCGSGECCTWPKPCVTPRWTHTRRQPVKQRPARWCCISHQGYLTQSRTQPTKRCKIKRNLFGPRLLPVQRVR